MISNCVYLLCMQSFGPVPAATLQVPPVWSRHTWPPALHLHQVCQPVSRDQINHSGCESPFPFLMHNNIISLIDNTYM